MHTIDKLNERLTFYQNAYNETSKDLKKVQKQINKDEPFFRQCCYNLIDTAIGEDLSPEERDLVENHFGLNLADLDKKYAKVKENKEKEIAKIKEDDRYKEYLRLLISEDHELAVELEDDEVFTYLIEQNFHNDKFRNEPYIEFLGFVYQPRFWKFRKYANKKAKEFGFENYEAMFKLWESLRINFKSLIGDKKIKVVLKECEELERQIKNLEEQIFNIPLQYLKDLKENLTEMFKVIPAEKLDVFEDREEVNNVISLREELNKNKELSFSLSDRLNAIMENINNVEKLISAVERGYVINEEKFNKFFTNTDPTIPVFELIPENEWASIEKAFAEKGIKLKSRENYSVVKTKLSQDEKEALLKEYGVKEGEIFFDKNLVGKKFRS